MDRIPTEKIRCIKINALEKFAQKDKHPSDILINDLCNSFLNSTFGEIILNKIKNMETLEK